MKVVQQAANVIKQVPPEYPPLAEAAHIQGKVRLRLMVSPEGVPYQIGVVSGPPLLIQAAKNAVQQWRFEPVVQNGQPVAVETFVEVIFSLDQKSKEQPQ
jgi:periplasmic protein TonB